MSNFCPVTRDTDDWMERNRDDNASWSDYVDVEIRDDEGTVHVLKMFIRIEYASDDPKKFKAQITQAIHDGIDFSTPDRD